MPRSVRIRRDGRSSSTYDGDENPGYEISVRSLIGADGYRARPVGMIRQLALRRGSTDAASLGGELNSASAEESLLRARLGRHDYFNPAKPRQGQEPW
jgi:hypothetical protein